MSSFTIRPAKTPAAPVDVISSIDLNLAVEVITARYLKECRAYHAKKLSAVAGSSPLPPPPRILVGLAGRPGSGKTTVLEVIAHRLQTDLNTRYNQQRQGNPPSAVAMPFAPHCVCMPMDGYHLYLKELAAMKNPTHAFERRGAEWTFSPEKLARDLRQLKTVDPATANSDRPQYPPVRVPSFDHGMGDPVEENITIPPTADVILVEGNYLLYRGTPEWNAVVDLWDVKIFFDCPRGICTERLCLRHMKAWNTSREKAMIRAMGSDTKNGDLVDTTRREADLLLRSVDLQILSKL